MNIFSKQIEPIQFASQYGVTVDYVVSEEWFQDYDVSYACCCICLTSHFSCSHQLLTCIAGADETSDASEVERYNIVYSDNSVTQAAGSCIVTSVCQSREASVSGLTVLRTYLLNWPPQLLSGSGVGEHIRPLVGSGQSPGHKQAFCVFAGSGWPLVRFESNF